MKITKEERKKAIRNNLIFVNRYLEDIDDATFNKKRCLIAIDDAIEELK